MRQPQNAKRGRGRGRRNNVGGNHAPNRNTSYESNGPDVKLRGNAQQLNEKYLALAHDASSAGERIFAEAYAQFADHYFRLHQAAVGAAETKRQQEQATQVADGTAAQIRSGGNDVGNGDGGEIEATDIATINTNDAEVPKGANGRGRARNKPAEADNEASLSPAQLAEAVQDEQDNKKVTS